MQSHRLILPSQSLSSCQVTDEISLTKEQQHYLSRVLRLDETTSFEICGNDGVRWLAKLRFLSKKECLAVLEENLPSFPPPTELILIQGLPKGEKFERILRQSTELGVTWFIPVQTKFCVTKIEANKVEKKMQRWQNIILDATRQSQQNFLPTLEKPCSLQKVLQLLPEDCEKIVCYEKETSLSLYQWFTEQRKNPKIALFIGPEGGFSPDEVAFLKQHGFTSVHLGKRILRTETAGPAVLSFIQFSP